MARFNGGSSVPGGYYWNPRNWSITPVAKDGEKLPGTSSDRYLRVHWLVALLLAPLLGGLFVVFLPFLGFAMLFNHLGKKAAGGLRRAADEVGAAVGPDWQPGMATFAGKKKAKKDAKAAKEAKKDEDEKKNEGAE